MSRKRFNALDEDQKRKVGEQIIRKMDDIAAMKDSFLDEFDIFDAVNDEAKTLFECNMDCRDCTSEDRANCMQNFRVANVFLLKQIRQMEHIITEQMVTFHDLLLEIGEIFTNKGEISEEKDKKLEKIDESAEQYYS